MLGRFDSLNDTSDPPGGVPWLGRLMIAWVGGLVLGSLMPSRVVLISGAGLALLMGVLCLRRRAFAGAQWSGLIALGLVAGAWLTVQGSYVAEHDVSRFIHDEPALAGLRGTILTEPRDVLPNQGPFGSYNYQGPGTMFELRVDAVDAGAGYQRASGVVLIRIKQHDHRPALGQRIEATGWLSAIGPTQNPGEFDYRAYLQRNGVSGRMTLMRRGNWQALGPPPRWTFTGIRRQIGDAASASLKLGMPNDPEMLALLDALLLGRRTGDMAELSESFRAVGLSHVLSISGAHLGILLLIVWMLGRLLIGRPRVVTLIVLAVLVLFLLAVPWRTPILRAAIMAGVFCVGYGLGRRVTGLELLSAAALIVLIWKPGDLFTAGFQLSFGVVGALLLYARPVSHWLMPEPDVTVVHPSAWDIVLRRVVDVVAVSVVAFLVAMPMVMFHFQLISPLAVVLSILALPVLTSVLALGYFKMIVGLLSPALGSVLAVPLAWAGDSLSGLVVQAQRYPGASVELWVSPSLAWTLGCLCVLVALFAGLFKRRYAALLGCVLVVSGWAWLEQRPRSVMDGERPPALVLNMLAVGDGSCFLLRSGDQTLMFDCGSRGYWRIGERSVVPALRAMGVRRIDTLMVSHADLDHFIGVVDVMQAVEVGRVLVSPDVLRKATQSPGSAAATLVERVRARGLEPMAITHGWREVMGDAELHVLWPTADYVSDRSNNNGLVLAVQAAGRRVLLNSDIEGEAIERLLALDAGALKADVSDLAHHGSFVEDHSPAWFAAVDPGLVLQSSGPRRVDADRWAGLLIDAQVPRLWTSERGMVQVQITADGVVTWTTHRGERYEVESKKPGR